MQQRAPKFAAIVLGFLLCAGLHGEETVRIGVLADRGKAACLEKWSATAEYLTAAIPDTQFTIVPLDFEDVFAAAEKDEIGFFLVNSAMYIELEAFHGVDRIATLCNLGANSIPHSVFGGVVFFKRENHPNPEWEDLEKVWLAAVNPSSFGGWLAPLREMKDMGLNTRKIFRQTEFLNNEDTVVLAVRDGRTDTGIVRTNTLERLAEEGTIRIQDFVTLEWQQENKEPHQGFGFLHSTRLYPEWAMARTTGISDALAKAVAIALLDMPPDSPAATSAHYKGWVLPMNYNPVRDCLQDLRVRPFEDFGSISFSEKIREYGLVLLIILTIMIAVVWILFLRKLVTLRIYGNQEHPTENTTVPGFTGLISVSGPWIIIGLVVICVLGNHILRNQVVLPRFEALELRDAKLRVADCVEAIRRELRHLGTTNHDWSYWDDTYVYIQDRNPAYIVSNMYWPELHDSGLDMVILCNLDGEVVWTEIHHPSQTETVQLEAFSVDRFPLNSPLIQASWPTGQTENSGFFDTEYGPMMVTCSIINTSDGESPAIGTMIFGQFIDEDLMSQLSEQLGANCELIVPQNELESDIFSKLSPGSQIIELSSEHELVGYGLLSGITGEPALLVRMRAPREIMERGRSIAGLISLIMFSAVVLICIGLFVWFSFLIIESVRRRRLIEGMVDERTADLRRNQEELQLANENLKLQTEYAFRMAEAADEANEVKSNFIANLGHEIRTPMQAVLGFVDLVQKTELTQKQREYLEKIHSSTKSLSGIVKDIFDFSRIEKGQIQIKDSPFTLDELKRELLDIFAPAAELKGLHLTINFSIGVRQKLIGDPLRIRQILGNLVANAVKFTTKGHIALTATILEMTEDSLQLRFAVEDTGIGITNEQKEKIFAAFRQVDGSRSRRYGGIGIGLTVAERLASLLGSTIEVESEPGKGSVFSFQVRLGLSGQEATVQVDIPEPAAVAGTAASSDHDDVVISEDAKVILTELAIQLEEGDAAAIPTLRELAANNAFSGAAELLASARRYDFEGALEQLKAVARREGIDLDSGPFDKPEA